MALVYSFCCNLENTRYSEKRTEKKERITCGISGSCHTRSITESQFVWSGFVSTASLKQQSEKIGYILSNLNSKWTAGQIQKWYNNGHGSLNLFLVCLSMITTLIKWEAGDIRILDGNYALQKHKKLAETQTSKSICTVQYFLTSFDEIIPVIVEKA